MASTSYSLSAAVASEYPWCGINKASHILIYSLVFAAPNDIQSGKQLVCTLSENPTGPFLFYLKPNLLRLTVTDDLISACGVKGSVVLATD